MSDRNYSYKKMRVSKNKMWACNFETIPLLNESLKVDEDGYMLNEPSTIVGAKIWSMMAFNGIDYVWANDMDDFFNQIRMKSKDKTIHLFFHNLKYYGSYILGWIDKKNIRAGNEYSVSLEQEFFKISIFNNSWYNMRIRLYFKEIRAFITFDIYDSHQLLPYNLEDLATNVGLEKSKMNYDYLKFYNIKSFDELHENEQYYIQNDVTILYQALYSFYDFLELAHLHPRNTISAIAFNGYLRFSKIQNRDYFLTDANYWKIDNLNTKEDFFKYLHNYYHGGLTLFNPLYKEKLIEENVYNYDVNNLYGSIVLYNSLPYGQFKSKNEWKKDDYILYELLIEELKPKTNIYTLLFYPDISYDSTFESKHICQKMSNIMLYMPKEEWEIQQHFYEIKNLKIVKEYHFNTRKTGESFVNFFTNLRTKYKNEKNSIYTQLSKLIINSFTGKNGQKYEMEATMFSNKNKNKELPLDAIPSQNQIYDNLIKYEYKTEGDFYDYIVAIAICSYGRIELMKGILNVTNNLKNPENFIYGDTDSIKSLQKLDHYFIDPKKLGKFKEEGVNKKFYFFGSKFYSKWDDKGKEIKIWSGVQNAHLVKESIMDLYVGYEIQHVNLDLKETRDGLVPYWNSFILKERYL